MSSQNTLLVESLIKHGANVNASDKYGTTPLIRAAESNNPTILNMILEAGADMKRDGRLALVRAAFQGRQLTLEILCKQSVDLNQKDHHGRTLLMQVCTINSCASAGILIEAGAKLNLQDVEGFTALMHAVYAGSIECAKMLKGAGANVGFKNKEGLTALDIANIENPDLVSLFT